MAKQSASTGKIEKKKVSGVAKKHKNKSDDSKKYRGQG